MALTRLDIESELGLTGMGESFHAASSLCHISIMVAGEGWWISLSATHGQMLSKGEKSGEHAGHGNSAMNSVSS
ncbi:hypothetical protein TNCV_1004541 [Trichonephila clavipes]|nr:hypothetical protein TNCV_1004541 [Trichonephila clavipes]